MHNRGTQVEFNMTKYEVIKKEIKEQIEDNILKPNQVIASEMRCADITMSVV